MWGGWYPLGCDLGIHCPLQQSNPTLPHYSSVPPCCRLYTTPLLKQLWKCASNICTLAHTILYFFIFSSLLGVVPLLLSAVSCSSEAGQNSSHSERALSSSHCTTPVIASSCASEKLPAAARSANSASSCASEKLPAAAHSANSPSAMVFAFHTVPRNSLTDSLHMLKLTVHVSMTATAVPSSLAGQLQCWPPHKMTTLTHMLTCFTPFNAPYLHFCPSSDSKTESNSTSSLSKWTCDLNHNHSLTSMQWSALSVVKHPLRPAFPARNEPPRR